MPFTFSHPAAAVPLYRLLGRWGSLSALVVGSMAPDFWYLFPTSVGRGNGHSLLGLFWFCLPIGMATYLLFHFLIKQPVLSVLPEWVSARLAAYAAVVPLTRIAWPAVLVSLVAGAGVHIVWDAFTHQDGVMVVAIPLLQTHLFAIDAYQVRLYKLLQHVSTLVGLSLLAWWSWRWLRTAPPQTLRLAISFSPRQRQALLTALSTLPALSALLVAVPVLSSFDVVLFTALVKRAVLTSMAVSGLALLLFGSGWHLSALLRDKPVST